MGYAVIPEAWATCGKVLSPIERAVLMAVASFADNTGKAWPSVARIVATSGISHGTCVRALASLETKGALHVTRSQGRQTIYQIDTTGPCDGLVRATDQSVRRTPPVRATDGNPSVRLQEPVRATDTKDPKKDPIEGSQGRNAPQAALALVASLEPDTTPTVWQRAEVAARAWNTAKHFHPKPARWDRKKHNRVLAAALDLAGGEDGLRDLLTWAGASDPFHGGHKAPRPIAAVLARDNLASMLQARTNAAKPDPSRRPFGAAPVGPQRGRNDAATYATPEEIAAIEARGF